MMQSFLGNPNNIKGIHVDHINHDSLDNRQENLRITEVPQNLRNRKFKNITNTSGYRNVHLDGKWWTVTIRINGKQEVMGKFKNVDDAGEHAELMRQKHYGEYAGLS